jgi:CRISPR-associated protein Cmr6
MIVGLGSENVLETGIRLHHNYGMPIIPGSALKGLAAHYCDQVWGERDNPTPSENALNFRGARKEDRTRNRPAEPQGKFHQLLFGSTDDSGCITFHDAWLTPDSPKPLVLDVMTPHHPKWLDGSVPPTDFDSPTPVPFLSVMGKFRVAVSWCGPPSDKAKGWTEFATSLICSALNDWGIGGKISSGYGRLVPPQTLSAAHALGSPQTTTTGFRPSGPASSGTRTKSSTPHGPRHERGAKITVTCVQPADGKKKAKFKADDGCIGHIASDEQPAVSADQTIELWVANRSDQGYTFSTTEPTKKQKQSNDRRKGGRGR